MPATVPAPTVLPMLPLVSSNVRSATILVVPMRSMLGGALVLMACCRSTTPVSAASLAVKLARFDASVAFGLVAAVMLPTLIPSV